MSSHTDCGCGCEGHGDCLPLDGWVTDALASAAGIAAGSVVRTALGDPLDFADAGDVDLMGLGCVEPTPLGEPVTIASGVVIAGAALWDRYGDSILDSIEDWLGFGCGVKHKYRDRIEGASDETLADWASGRSSPGWTGDCREEGMRDLAVEVKRRLAAQGKTLEDAKREYEAAKNAPSAAQQRAAEIERLEAAARQLIGRGWPDRVQCKSAVRDLVGSRVDVRPMRSRMFTECNRYPLSASEVASANCRAPGDALLVGVGTDGYCAMTAAQRAELVAKLADVLTDGDRVELSALPIAMRAKRFGEIVRERVDADGITNGSGAVDDDGGLPWWVVVLLLLALGGGAAIYYVRTKEDA